MGDLINYDAHVGEVLLCPSADKVSTNLYGVGACDTSWLFSGSVSNIAGSYNFNGWLYSGDTVAIVSYSTGTPADMFTNLASIQKPALTPIFCDSVWFEFWPMPNDEPNINLYLAGGTSNPAGIQRIVMPRHGWMNPAAAPRNFNLTTTLPGGVNLGLSDGHVEMPRLESLWSYYWNRLWVVPKTRPGL
jgi:hypothetical protein